MVKVLHTITIMQEIKSIKIFNSIFESVKSKTLENNNKFFPSRFITRKGIKIPIEWTSYFLSNEGFHKIVLKNSYAINNKKYYRGISFEINPIRMIDKINKLRLTVEKDIEQIAFEFDKIMQDISPYLVNFFRMKVDRIDYTIDLKVSNIKQYILLFQRSDNPNNFMMQYSRTDKKRKQMKDSYYLKSKSITINFYDKEQQQIKQGYTDQEILDAKNVLRFEVQCEKLKIYNIKTKHNFSSRELYNYLELNHSREQILVYYNKTISIGDYYKQDKAIQIINKSQYQQKTKENLIKVLKLIANKRSVTDARQEFIKGIDDKKEIVKAKVKFNTYLKKIRELGVNVVVIPEGWGIAKLENLFPKLIKQFEIEGENIEARI